MQIEPLILCLVQPAPAGTPSYKGQLDLEPDTRPSPRDRSTTIKRLSNPNSSVNKSAVPTSVNNSLNQSTSTAVVEKIEKKIEEESEIPLGRTRRRRSAAS